MRLLHRAPLDALLEEACSLRKSRIITYSRKVFLPLTTLCRDKCAYCTFRREPGDAGAHFLFPDEVMETVRAGALAGCREALFSLGDAPEAVHEEARRQLAALGYSRTIDYLASICRVVLDQSPLFPHSNAGLLDRDDLATLKPVNASLGLMLESTSTRLLEPGGPHAGTRTKRPADRLAAIKAAGEMKIPFTTGILIGIGETAEERVDALFVLRDANDRYGHIQEVIIQNFRPKPTIAMAQCVEPSIETMLRTIAVARLIFGPEMNIQAPPNLSADYGRLLDAGINDWGGISPVTPDFINPDDAWPELGALRRTTADRGFLLRQRLPVYPDFLLNRPECLPSPLRAALRAAAGSDGLVPEA